MVWENVNFFIILAAITPALILVGIILHTDRRRPEPLPAIIIALLTGIITVFLAMLLNSFITPYLFHHMSELDPTRISLNFDSMISVAVVEEGLKFFFLFLFMKFNKAFDDPYDGIVYGSLIALSFSGIENILYLANPLHTDQAGAIAISRALTSVPMHMVVGMAMGYYLAMANFSKDSNKSRKFIYLSLLVPIIIHGMYNALIINTGAIQHIYPVLGMILLVIWYLIVVGIYIGGYKTVKNMAHINEYFYSGEEYPPKYSFLYNAYEYDDILKEKQKNQHELIDDFSTFNNEVSAEESSKYNTFLSDDEPKPPE